MEDRKTERKTKARAVTRYLLENVPIGESLPIRHQKQGQPLMGCGCLLIGVAIISIPFVHLGISTITGANASFNSGYFAIIPFSAFPLLFGLVFFSTTKIEITKEYVHRVHKFLLFFEKEWQEQLSEYDEIKITIKSQSHGRTATDYYYVALRHHADFLFDMDLFYSKDPELSREAARHFSELLGLSVVERLQPGEF